MLAAGMVLSLALSKCLGAEYELRAYAVVEESILETLRGSGAQDVSAVAEQHVEAANDVLRCLGRGFRMNLIGASIWAAGNGSKTNEDRFVSAAAKTISANSTTINYILIFASNPLLRWFSSISAAAMHYGGHGCICRREKLCAAIMQVPRIPAGKMALALAHEIAHSMGVEHDDYGSPSVMTPNLPWSTDNW